MHLWLAAISVGFCLPSLFHPSYSGLGCDPKKFIHWCENFEDYCSHLSVSCWCCRGKLESPRPCCSSANYWRQLVSENLTMFCLILLMLIFGWKPNESQYPFYVCHFLLRNSTVPYVWRKLFSSHCLQFLEYNFIKVVLDRSFVQKRTVNILLTFEIKHHLENSAASGSENASACMHAQMDGQVKNVEANSHRHARHDKTVLSVSRPLRRCELDSRQLKTVADRKFEVWTRSEQSSNSHRHTRHDTDRTVLSCLVWRCELSRPDSQTSAFCVWCVPECVGRRSATAGRTLTQNSLVRRSVHTGTPDTTQTGLFCRVWCAGVYWA